jgi:Cu-processing system permease protein
MTAVLRITLFGLRDLIRNRWTVFYFLFFLIATEGLLRMTGDTSKALVSLLNIVLFLVPMVSVLFGTMYFYHSRKFVKLLLSQPISRKSVYMGQFVSLSASLSFGFTLGVTVPFVFRQWPPGGGFTELLSLVSSGLFLTVIFVGLAFLVSVTVIDRGKGVALSLFMWLVAAVLYDGAVLLLAHLFSSYPLERPLLIAAVLNPIDLARILLLLRLDVSALMGYTGAVFERFFGSGLGVFVAASCLILWAFGPLLIGIRRFSRQDL